MAQIIGNIHPSLKGANPTFNAIRGIGKDNIAPIPVGLVQVAGSANEVIRLSVSQSLPSVGEIVVCMQSSVSVSIRYTLSNPNVATDPEMYDEAVWTDSETLTAGPIKAPNNGMMFSAIEITFSGPGIFCMYVR